MAKNSLGEIESNPGASHREMAAVKRDLLASRLEAAKTHREAALAFNHAAESVDEQIESCALEISKYMNIPKAWKDDVHKSGSFNLSEALAAKKAHQAQSAKYYRSMDESTKAAREFNSFSKNMRLRIQILGHDLTARVQNGLAVLGIK